MSDLVKKMQQHAQVHRIAVMQLTIASNALLQIANGEPGARAIAQDAVRHIAELVPKPEDLDRT